MRHRFTRSQMFFALAVVGTLVAALLPQRYLGWTRDMAAIVRFPFTPMGQAGNALASWLRPADGIDHPYDESDIDILVAEKEHLRVLLEAERRRAADLEAQLTHIQGVGSEYTDLRVRPLLAKITARNASELIGPVELNRGELTNVTIDTVAVFNRVHLIGRVTEVGAVRSTLVPIAHEDAGLLTAAVMAADRPGEPIVGAPKVLLEPVGDGTFTGDIARTHAVAVGDEVRLIDSTWPETAQALIIGTVESVEPKPQMPLRNVITVRPHYQVYELFRLTLKLELEEGHAQDSSPALTNAQRTGGGGGP